jgi:hypothetical protein
MRYSLIIAAAVGICAAVPAIVRLWVSDRH